MHDQRPPHLCVGFVKKVVDGEENRRKKKEEGVRQGWVRQKKEQLTVIIVMFNQTPAITLINTLFPV